MAAAWLLGVAVGSAGAAAAPLDGYNVTWDTPGPTSAASMPLGNGDIGLNVWAEPDGAVCCYIGKTDAWNDNDWWQSFDPLGLMKLGGVRLQVSPNPFTNGAPFTQVLKLHEGEILIREGPADNAVALRLWVDANHPVIRVEATSARPVTLQASLIDWRLGAANPDVVLSGQTNAITWYHRNRADTDAHVANLTFGATITGPGLVVRDNTNLVAMAPELTQRLTVYPLTAQTATAADWVTELQHQVAQTDALDWETCRQAHRQWWDDFWQRSWVFLEGDGAATNVTRGYVLQRFITACGGRGAYPIKFNGSLFVVDDPARNRTPDYRDWGGQYWFQNTRAMYWPRLAAGDFDLMLPLFHMYAAQVPGNSALVKKYYGHEGAYFAETAPFWGGLLYMGPEVKENWTGHYFLPVLEISMMMLDYYDYTGDDRFARDTLLPVASAGIKFYDQHFPRDAQGKLLLDPVNSIEMFWKVHDPAPDLAGLHAVLPRLIALTNNFVPPAEHAAWVRLLGELSDLPVGTNNGRALLLPYTGPQTNKSHNAENPELYSIFPFRLYGGDRPDLQLARDTFRARKFTQKGCWIQDPIQAAMLGMPSVAREYVTFNFTNREPRLKFPAFWAKMNDYAPDEDNGGCGEHALQSMLLQADGRKILLLPAWPKEWNAQFKLHAPFNTTVQGRVEGGRLTDLVVMPPERRADVVDMSQREAGLVGVWSFHSPLDAIFPLKQTISGSTNVYAVPGDFGGASGNEETVTNLFDDNLATKYFNKARAGVGQSPGINTGFVVTLAAGPKAVNGIRFATANDAPGRDPHTITVEGAAANGPGDGAAFVLLYSGSAGLDDDPGRNQWGRVVSFSNAIPYRTYRVLVTAASAAQPDAVQYSEVRMGSVITMEIRTGYDDSFPR